MTPPPAQRTRIVPSLEAGLVVLAGLVAAFGCGAGDAGRPGQPNAAEVSGRSACSADPSEHDEPLVVDLQPEQRADLEVAMRAGVAVVAYDCASLRVLPDCAAPGGYAFSGTSPKEQIVRLVDGDAIRATLPLSGAGLAAELGGELARGRTLDLGLVMIGKKSARQRSLTADDMRGACEGATHVVHSSILGAFALRTGSRAEARTMADLFGAGAMATSSSSKHVETREGRLEACHTASSSAHEPPAGCDAVLRLELVRVLQPPPPLAIVSPDFAESLRGKTCPDPEACRAACDQGDARSCLDWAILHAIGDRMPRDLGVASRAADRACRLGETNACTLIGLALLAKGSAGANVNRGRAYLERPCERGVPVACATLGLSYANGGDDPRARHYRDRACRLGHEDSCRTR